MRQAKENFFGIRNPQWWFQETPSVFQYSYPWMKGITRLSEYYDIDYGILVIPFKKDYIWQVLEIKHSIKLAEMVIDNMAKDKEYLNKIIKRWELLRDEYLKVLKKITNTDLKKLPAEGLANLYQRFLDKYMDELIPSIIIESFEPFTERYYKNLTARDEIDKKKLHILEEPDFQSFIFIHQLDLLKICLRIAEEEKLSQHLKKGGNPEDLLLLLVGQFPEIYQDLKMHTQNYFWLKNNYKDIVKLNEEYFLQEIIEEIKNNSIKGIRRHVDKLTKDVNKIREKKLTVTKELNLTPKDLVVFKIFNILSWWQDERKKYILQGCHYLNLILKQVASLTGYKIREVEYMTREEIKDLLINKKLVRKELIRKRRQNSIWIGLKGKEYWYTGKEADGLKRLIFAKEKPEEKEIMGITASPGFVTGKVRIVLDPQKDKFKEGEILVTSMTRPEFVHLMKQAKAIVTNEGGLTCHAAIVSRELGIPCIVGTKKATKIFKDGDIIEVRAHRGSVKKLN